MPRPHRKRLPWVGFWTARSVLSLGTHTHVQTSDEKVLPQGTAYMTDVGMTGPADSVIGVKKELAIDRFLTQMPHKFEVAKKELVLEGAVLSIDPETGRAKGDYQDSGKVGGNGRVIVISSE